MNETIEQSEQQSKPSRPWLLASVETVLIFVLLFAFAAAPTPGDDEPHYLGKAKQYWNPDWLAGDFFLETPDAHMVFNWTLGWLTMYFSLDAVAWIGRCAAWLLLAFAWRRLSWALLPRPLISLWTMALFLVFQEHGTAAQEWIVRGVEAKCFAYAFVILGLEQLVRGRWHWVWPLLGIGAAFHVLVGGWAVVAALFAWAATKERMSLVTMLPSLIAGGLLSLPGLIPSLMLSWNADPEVVAEANQIYVFERLGHHLAVYYFTWQNKLQFVLVLLAWLTLCYLTKEQSARLPLRRFVLGSILIGIAGLVIDQATTYLDQPELSAALLRFYWYRLPDMMVPLGLAFAISAWALGERNWPPPKFNEGLLFVFVLLPMLVLGWHFHLRRTDGRPMADVQGRLGIDARDPVYLDWLQTCDWVKANTPPDARFMIPTNISSFRWYAERSEVVSRKDIPQNPAGIVQWRQRLQDVNRWYYRRATEGMTQDVRNELLRLASPEVYDFQYVIVRSDQVKGAIPLERHYPPSFARTTAFYVYKVLSSQPDEKPAAD